MGWGKLRVVHVTLAAGAALLLGATPATESPRLARPGLWDISLSATGSKAQRVCLGDPMLLTQWEHRGDACTRVVIAENGSEALVRYTCAGGGFGQSVITLLTPRSIKVETQGISNGLPFNYPLYAWRAGECRKR